MHLVNNADAFVLMLCSIGRAQLERWLNSYRHSFQQSCFDLIDRMRIDWHAGYSYSCEPR